MRKDITIAAAPRESRGKNEARRLRVAKLVPAVVYGTGKDPVAVSIDPKEISKILHSSSGHNTIFNVSIGETDTAPVMIVDWQKDPVKDYLLHVDLKRIDLSQRIRVKVPVHPVGEPKGVKVQGGLHEIVTREIEIECLPDDIPEGFDVNVSEYLIGQSLRAGDVPLSGSMTLVSPAEQVISHVIALRATAEAAPAAEGAAPAAGAAAAEPEVIKKGKKEEAAAEGAGDKKKK